MANDGNQIVVGANGTVWVAAVNATEPTTPTATPAAGWADLGFISEDGVTFTDSKETESVGVWQSFYAARRIQISKDATVSFMLKQWNPDTVSLAFGGGTVTEPSASVYKYVPPSPEELDERALMIDWQDGDKNYRLIMPKGMVIEAVETNLTRSGAADLPITFAATPAAGDDAWYLLTDDPALEPAGT